MASPTVGYRPQIGRHTDAPFELDAILPAQFAQQRRAPASPAHRLWFAVLESALSDLREIAAEPRARQRRQDAIAWFSSTACAWPGDFACICDALGLDADAIRDALARADWRLRPGAKRLSEQAMDRRRQVTAGIGWAKG